MVQQPPTGHYRIERGKAAEFRKVSWWRFKGTQVVVAAGVESMTVYTWTAYVWPIFIRIFMQEYKWSATQMGFISSVNRVMDMWMSPACGWLGDTFGPRLVAIIGMVFDAICWAIYAVSSQYWHILFANAVVVNFGAENLWSRGMHIAIVRWWVDRRAVAMSIQWILSGLSGTIWLPIVAVLMEAFGWRWGAWLGVITCLFIALPTALLYPSQFPEQYGQYVDNQTPEERRARAEREAARRGARVRARPALADLTIREALLDRSFWLLTLGAVLVSFGAAPLSLFQQARMGSLGYSVVTAALFYSLRNWMSYGGRLFMLFFGDWLGGKYPVRYTYALIVFWQGIALLMFGWGNSDIWFYGWAVVNGLPYGAGLVWLNYLMAEYFGRAAFGTLGGLRLAFIGFGGFVAPILMGWLADVYGWEWPFTWACFCYTIGAIAYCFAVPPKKQVREAEKGQESA